MKTRFIYLPMVIVLTVGLVFQGCGVNNNVSDSEGSQDNASSLVQESQSVDDQPAAEEITTAPESAEPVPLTWMIVSFGSIKFEGPLKIYDAIGEYAGAVIKPVPVPEDTFVEKFMISLNARDLCDITTGWGLNSTIQQFGPQGLFIPYTDHMDQLPHLKEWFDKYEKDLKPLLALDGKMYDFPVINEVPWSDTGVLVRKDLLQKGGVDLDSIETVEDLYQAYLVLKEYTDGPIMGARGALYNMEVMAKIHNTSFLSIIFDEEKNSWGYTTDTQNTKDAVQFLANMYNDGLLSKDWASMSDEVWESGFRTGKLTAAFDTMLQLAPANITMKTTVGPEAESTALLPPKYNGVRHPWPNYGGHISYGTNGTINGSTEHLDQALKVFDWMYNWDNYELIMYGEEGVTFEYREDGTRQHLDLDWEAGDGPMSQIYGSGYVDSWMKISSMERKMEVGIFAPDQQPMTELLPMYIENIYTYEISPLAFTTEESEILQNYKNPLDTYIQENITKFISNMRPMSEWEQFISGLDAFNPEQVEQVYNTALARVND